MDITHDTEAVRKLLTGARRIAVVGLSPKEERDSNMVARYLIEQGYEVIPVNPGHPEILGLKSHRDVRSVPGPVDIVDIFRGSEHVPPVVEDAIAASAKAVWMQLGAGNEEAAKRATEAGLDVVIEQCIKVAHTVLRVGPKR